MLDYDLFFNTHARHILARDKMSYLLSVQMLFKYLHGDVDKSDMSLLQIASVKPTT